MSTILSALALGTASTIQSVLLRQGRSIAGIIPNVVVTESHVDELTITDHPVEQGASITDHAFKQPSQISLVYGWSNSGLNLLAPSAGDINSVYQQLLELQASRVPFDVTTGKRSYTNMLIKTLGVTTDQTTENVLLVTATLRQIIIVETTTTTLQPAENQAMPQKTAETVNSGTKQPQASNESLLFKGYSQGKSVVQSLIGG